MSGHIYRAVAAKGERTVPNRSSWSDALVLSLMVAAPAALVLFAFYATAQVSHPTDEELIARFLRHESDFQTIIQMLDADCGSMPHRTASCELADLVPTANISATRMNNYELLLARIGAKNFRYFPRSGNLTLPVSKPGGNFAETEKSYLYLRHGEPQPLLRHQGYNFRGPGVYLLTGDYRIKGHWFIHHDGTVVVAFSPY